MPVPDSERSLFTYSHFGRWSSTVGDTVHYQAGWFAYGEPASAIPVTGTAHYQAQIHGTGFEDPDPYYYLGGDVELTFDFESGTLTGMMHPQIFGNGFGIDHDFGRYDFAATSFNRADGTYSGSFSPPAGVTGESWFRGMLTGPAGAETVATFAAPFEWGDGTMGSLTGIWIGKKD